MLSYTQPSTVKFRLQQETRGALRFAEIDEKGVTRNMNDPETVIGTLYIRKASLMPGEILPKGLEITVGLRRV